mmetsp:Transcript_5220/g.14602  ORF Transcript_5220/g.14602 Transcript_5220/m.14602 type:complete len:399 (+) Transcript_5220:488-1684(+)
MGAKRASARAEAIGEYWWVRHKDQKAGFTIPFHTVEPVNAQRTTITPTISQLHLFYTAGSALPAPPPAVGMVQIRHVPNPGMLNRYKCAGMTQPMQRPEAGAFGPLKTEKAEKHLGRAEAGKIEDHLEEMAVDDLMAGRMQLMPGNGRNSIVARQMHLPRVPRCTIWEKRQRSPVRQHAIPKKSTRQSLLEGQEILTAHKLPRDDTTGRAARASLVSLKDYLAGVSSLKNTAESPPPSSVLQFSPRIRTWADPRLAPREHTHLSSSVPTLALSRNSYTPPMPVVASIGSPIDLRFHFDAGLGLEQRRPMTQQATRAPHTTIPNRPASQPANTHAARRQVSQYSPPFQPKAMELEAEGSVALTTLRAKIMPVHAVYNSTASGIMQEYSRRVSTQDLRHR